MGSQSDNEESGKFLRAEAYALYGFTLIYLALWWWMGEAGSRDHFYEEGGPIDWISSVYLVFAAFLTWALWTVERRRNLRGAWFWLIASCGFGFLAIDERFQLHERLHNDVLFDLLGDPWGFRNWNDVAILGYGLIAAVALVLAVPALSRYRPSLKYLAIGVGCYVMHTGIDSLVGGSVDWKNIVEEAFKVLAGASFALTFYDALHRALIESHRPDERLLPCFGRPSWQRVAAIALFSLLVTQLLTGFGSAWQDELEAGWGEALSWIVSVLLGGSALFAAFIARQQDSTPARIVWLVACGGFALVAFDNATISCWNSFWNAGSLRDLGGLSLGAGAFLRGPWSLATGLVFGTALLIALVADRRSENSGAGMDFALAAFSVVCVTLSRFVELQTELVSDTILLVTCTCCVLALGTSFTGTLALGGFIRPSAQESIPLVVEPLAAVMAPGESAWNLDLPALPLSGTEDEPAPEMPAAEPAEPVEPVKIS